MHQLIIGTCSFWFRQVGGDEDSGIDGILSRLEKQRYSDFLAIKSAKKGNESQSKSEDEGEDEQFDTPGSGKFVSWLLIPIVQ